MPAVKAEVRSGAYYDSVVLMQLQRSLGELPGVLDTGVVMGTEANKEILAQSDLLVPQAQAAGPDDLVIVVRATDEVTAEAAIDQVEALLVRKRSADEGQDYLPKSMETAAQMLPEAHWVLVSVPGRYAASVARDALRLGKHVFLFSDNVSVEDEIDLKRSATEKGLFVMGPDCGTAIVNGVGLGFANRVRQGPIGMVAASGTGLQQVSSRIHQLGSGVSHALGTGGRDLSKDVGALTAQQALETLIRDPETRVIVLVSKPPAKEVADQLLRVAQQTDKPVVVDFIGYTAPAREVGNLHFVKTFDEAAELAVALAQGAVEGEEPGAPQVSEYAADQRYLRGLFSGGTLAYEALLILQEYLPVVYSNAPLKKGQHKLENSLESRENTIIDLGEDEFTVGRLHPMMDNELRIRRLHQEASDPEVAVILLDVVLGYGSHLDPASELGPAIAEALQQVQEAGRHLEVVAVVVGTDEDPQGIDEQVAALEAAGARIYVSNEAAVRYVGQVVRALNRPSPESPSALTAVDLGTLTAPLAAINLGLESFAESVRAQEAQAIHVDWKPAAGGNERLAAILERMKGK